MLAARVKVMAQLDIAERRLPQDGRISLRVAGRAVDVRVSTIPSGHGERVVLRLLDKDQGRLDLTQLGMPSDVESALSEIVSNRTACYWLPARPVRARPPRSTRCSAV